MVAGAFPLIKLVTLGIKQIAKPIANGIIIGAKQSDLFKRQVVWFSRKGTSQNHLTNLFSDI